MRDPLWMVPGFVRHALRRLLPKATGDRLREFVIARYYAPGMVLRTGVVEYWWGRVWRKRPRLHRLVVHITDHCNLDCKGCSHFSNIAEPAFADPEQLDREFARLAELVEITEIYLLGGEPLLHPGVAELARSARRYFPHSKIVLLTNGILLPRMGPEFWQALGECRITLMYDDYPIRLQTELIRERAAEHGVGVELMEHDNEFLKVPIDLEGSQDGADSFARCRTVMNCPTLRDGRLYPCAYIAYIDLFRKRFGIEGLEATDSDSISIFETADPYRIMTFLLNPVPWCRHCDFDSAEHYAWDRSARTIDEWTIPAHGRVAPSREASNARV